MSQTAMRLGRLLAIRKLNEDLNRRTLEIALASVTEVEAGIASQEAVLTESHRTARAALSQGDRPEWLMADAQAEVAGWNRRRLKTLLHARAETAAEAMRAFLESRSQHEQVRQLVEDAQRTERTEQDHRAQLSADDWFLSKRERPQD
jgi:hypothetical protein